MKITKKVREEAWLLCAIAASNSTFSLADAHMELALSPSRKWDVWKLAMRARLFASERLAHVPWEDCTHHLGRYWNSCAEAAALLADGWCPNG